ncbi:hypothetical protein, conserved [Plasmodium gonderi]|uniref:Uncharacterized protein n=1 Tax=Plasmodium gonderi TaxID=77519 RepID=A0A1Y1JN04_PLAGO|nr:hypothetical protein, conserved [Plasmodium gonderi]GAW81773.1 hypothetical protein, conserved [Plasmodium gonderi]
MQNAWNKFNKAMQNIQNVILTDDDDSLFLNEKCLSVNDDKSGVNDEDNLTKREETDYGNSSVKLLSQTTSSLKNTLFKISSPCSGDDKEKNLIDTKNILYEEIVKNINLCNNLLKNEKVQLLVNEYQINYNISVYEKEEKNDLLLLNYVCINKYILFILTKFLNINLIDKMEFIHMNKEEYDNNIYHLFLNILSAGGNIHEHDNRKDTLFLNHNYKMNYLKSDNSNQYEVETKEEKHLNLKYKGEEQVINSHQTAPQELSNSSQYKEETFHVSYQNHEKDITNGNINTHHHEMHTYKCTGHDNDYHLNSSSAAKREDDNHKNYEKYNEKYDTFYSCVDKGNVQSEYTKDVVIIEQDGNKRATHRSNCENNVSYNSLDDYKNNFYQNNETPPNYTNNYLSCNKSMKTNEEPIYGTELNRIIEFFPPKVSLTECKEDDFCINEMKIDLKNVIKSMKEENNVKIDLLNDRIKYLESEIIKNKERMITFQKLKEDVEKYKKEINNKNKIIEDVVREKGFLQNDINVMQTKLEHSTKIYEDKKKLTKYCQENHVDKQLVMEMLKNSRDSLKATNIKNQVFLILCDILGIKNVIQGVQQEKTISDQFLEFLDQETKDP